MSVAERQMELSRKRAVNLAKGVCLVHSKEPRTKSSEGADNQSDASPE